MTGVRAVESINEISMPSTGVLREALAVIDRGSAQVCLVVDSSDRLLGLLTDGDVRRALLDGHSLDAPVDALMNRHFQSKLAPVSLGSAKNLMSRLEIRHLPILNHAGKVVQFLWLSDAPFAGANLAVVVLAGGQGMRLRPLTERVPKPMLPIGDKPILERVLDHCLSAGFTKVYLSVNYLGAQIEEYFQDGGRWGLEIDYLREDQPLGTAGSLGLLPQGCEATVVLNGDVLTDVNLRRMVEFHEDRESRATIALRDFNVEVPFGVVSTDGFNVLEIKEKPVFRYFVNAGVYVLSREIVELIQLGEAIDMPDLLRRAIDQGMSVQGFPVHEDWLDVGTFESLKKARDIHS